MSLVSRRGDIRRLLKFCVVGGSGIPVDFAIVSLCLAVDIHYVLANAIGWLIAVTWNFALNYTWTWNRPDGTVGPMYAEYLGADVVLFAVRAAVVAGLVELLDVDELVATLVGIATVAAATFVVADTVIFDQEEVSDSGPK